MDISTTQAWFPIYYSRANVFKTIIDEMIRERLLKLDGEFSIQNKELFINHQIMENTKILKILDKQ